MCVFCKKNPLVKRRKSEKWEGLDTHINTDRQTDI